MIHYEEVPQSVKDIFNEVKAKYFSELDDAYIQLLFDTRESEKPWLAQIRKPSKLVRHLTADQAPEEGWDYIILIDKIPWNLYNEGDQKRLIRHELRHCDYDPEKTERSAQYRLRKHDIEDFYEEVQLATKEGELRWKERASTVASAEYARLKEQKKQEKKAQRKRKKDES